MGSFEIRVKRKALKKIQEFRDYRERLIELFSILKRNPIPFREFDVVKLRGYKNTYRVRLGRLRIIYEVDWNWRVITVLVVAERGKAYGRS